MYFKVYGATDVGQRRSNNEDAFRYHVNKEKGRAIVAVADGVGGSAGGEVASDIAVNCLVEEVINAIDSAGSQSALLESAFDHTNEILLKRKQEHSELSRMGTTLVACIAQGERLVIGNVGDSRCYKINRDSTDQLTTDHSLSEELKQQGLAYEDRMPYENVITRVMGSDELYRVDLFVCPLFAGDRFLFCSDGLTNFVSETEMGTILHSGADGAATIDKLIRTANQNGGGDNITAVILECCQY